MRSKAPAGFGGRLPGKGPHLPIWDLAGQPILSTNRRTHASAYLHADMEIKERALARLNPPGGTPGRYSPPDSSHRLPQGPSDQPAEIMPPVSAARSQDQGKQKAGGIIRESA